METSLSIRISKKQKEEINSITNAEGTSVAAIVREYLSEYAKTHRETAHRLAIEKAQSLGNPSE